MSSVRKVTGLSPRGVEHRAVERELLADARHVGRDHELQLGAEQADAGGAGLGEMRQVDQQARH